MSEIRFKGRKRIRNKEIINSFYVQGTKFSLNKSYQFISVEEVKSTAIVIKCLDKNSFNNVSIRKVSNLSFDYQKAKALLKQIKITKYLDHESIVSIKSILLSKKYRHNCNDFYIVTDPMMSNLTHMIFKELSKDHIKYISLQILLAIKHMHDFEIVHGNLSLSNIWINENCEVKLNLLDIDSDDENINQKNILKSSYLPPENLLFDSEKNKKGDLWSVGCIIAELVLKEKLFCENNYFLLIKKILSIIGTTNYDFVQNSKTKEFLESLPYESSKLRQLFYFEDFEFIDLLTKLLEFDQTKRITVDEALKHKYFEDLYEYEEDFKAKIAFDFSYEKKLTPQNINMAFFKEAIKNNTKNEPT